MNYALKKLHLGAFYIPSLELYVSFCYNTYVQKNNTHFIDRPSELSGAVLVGKRPLLGDKETAVKFRDNSHYGESPNAYRCVSVMRNSWAKGE